MYPYPTLLLGALLCAAVFHDLRVRRIPNAVVYPGMLAALALHALLPPGGGLFGAPAGGLGLLSSLGGLALGLAALMPMYALRVMGAGDVKLLAMAGAFVGAGQAAGLALATLLAGGVLALAAAAWRRSLGPVLANVRGMLVHGGMAALAGMDPRIAVSGAAHGRLPYALAITAATALCVAWLDLVGELPL